MIETTSFWRESALWLNYVVLEEGKSVSRSMDARCMHAGRRDVHAGRSKALLQQATMISPQPRGSSKFKLYIAVIYIGRVVELENTSHTCNLERYTDLERREFWDSYPYCNNTVICISLYIVE